MSDLLQTPTTLSVAVYNPLQGQNSLQGASAALAILPDASPFPLVSGPDALQKGGESPLYAKLGTEGPDWRASGILHDINNQLAIILSHCSIALNKLPPESTARQNLDRSIRATKRAADLSSQLQMVTEEGLEETLPINLNDLVNESLELLEPRLSPVANLELSLHASLPSVTVSPVLMQRVLLNLLFNALQALADPSNSNKGIIQVTTEPLTIPPVTRQSGTPPLPPGSYVFFQIADSGVGMSQETMNQIFEPYFTTRVNCMGLGLTTSLRIVQAHEGIMLVWSTLGQGSTFRVLLPVSTPEE